MNKGKPFYYNKNLVLSLVGILLFLINFTPAAAALKKFSNAAFTPILFYSSNGGLALDEFFATLYDIRTLRKENNDLLLKNALLEADNATLSLLAEENKALSQELKLGSRKEDILEVKLLPPGAGNVQNRLILNAGTVQGVKTGNVVRLGNMFVGVVESADEKSSFVRLSYSPESVYQVVVVPGEAAKKNISQLKKLVKEGKGLEKFKGIARGTSTAVVVEDISNDAEVKEGDAVLINDPKINDILYLGMVISVSADPSAVEKILSITLPLDFDNLNYAFVVLDND